MLRTLLFFFLCIQAVIVNAQISADTAAYQSMKYMANSNTEGILRDLERGGLDAILTKCGNEVDYYDRGLISKASVRAAIARYFQRWSNRRYSNITVSLQESDFGRGTYNVQADFDWTVSNASDTKSGRSRLRLVWKGFTNANLSILGWKEQRL
jgi:hypothetical protein